jgi:hypothetical protein
VNGAFQGYVFDADEHVDILGLLGHLSDVLRSLKQVQFNRVKLEQPYNGHRFAQT